MIVELEDKDRLEAFLARDVLLHIYEIGDLDPFFWPDTRFWGITGAEGELAAVVLHYKGTDPSALLLLDRSEPALARQLLRQVREHLPARFYAHLSPGLVDQLPQAQLAASSVKMGLSDRAQLASVPCADVEQLSVANRAELSSFYAESYPENWFDERMLESEHYFGIREQGRLIAAGGVHVYSPVYRVAALGNVATHPDHRRRGLARRVMACLCQALLASVDVIGLNVHAENAPAIACYERLGFEVVAECGEYWVG